MSRVPPCSFVTAAAVLMFAAGPAAAATPPGVAPPTSHLKALSWRSVGPANMSGRISDIAVRNDDPFAIVLGTGTGGLFKSGNRGTTWKAIFDDQPTASIGAIGLWPRNKNVIWVGTGEANSRNSSSWGAGVFASDDGGDTWRHAGLAATHHVSRVIVHPADSNVVYVAALGRLWGDNPERGVFKTRDGGRTWEHVLKVDARTGAVDLVMDPGNPDVLYAAMYARRRYPWAYVQGGTTGGIFRTRDGGRNWQKLSGGLPATTGRIGLDVWRKDPRVLYAVVESDEGGRMGVWEEKSRTGGVFRSADGGDTWERMSPWAPRAFYYSQIRVQPDDDTRVYLLGTDLYVSDDRGRTFRAGGTKDLHTDCHAMWVSPDGRTVMLGTDGGLYISHDRAETWDYVNNLALGEFYNITLDTSDPYRICGGLQDNQTWCGPSRTYREPEVWIGEQEHRGILNDDWFLLGGGDGFHVQVDPRDPNTIYYESQGGYLQRHHLVSGAERMLRPSPREGEPSFRFNWNTPFLISPHDPDVLWMGGNRVFKLTHRGDRWEIVSPDLTTRNPDRMVTDGSAAETHCTIVTLTESPKQAGVLWAGTDDGKVWVSRDGGGAWTDLTSNLRGVPPGLYMSRIEPSHHDAGTAYLAIDGHRTNVFDPYLLVTRDFGRTWTSIVGDLPRTAPVKVVREDPVNPNLLYAGTEHGMYVSLDRGRHWFEPAANLPTVAVDDIQIHPRERDVVIGTHGRSVWVLDDVSALQQWNDRAAAQDSVTFFAPRAATAYHVRPIGGVWGQRTFAAKNPAFGAWLHYYLPADRDRGVSIAITDSSGAAVRTLQGPGTAGLHRVVWDLRAGEPIQRMDRPEWNGQPLYVRPGRYTVKFTYGKATREFPLEVKAVAGLHDGIE